jgi:hypothetical protein
VEGLFKHNGSVTKDRSERVVVHPFAKVDDQIAAFCTAFADLRKDFDSRLTLSTALFLSQAMTKIDAISPHLHLKLLCNL